MRRDETRRGSGPGAAVARAVFVVCFLGACGGDDDGSEPREAKSTPSGLDRSRTLRTLTSEERMQFCVAAETTVYSATTPERECELAAVSTVVGLPGQDLSCEEIKADCVMSFIEAEAEGCKQEIEEAIGCAATVGDGEACSLATAMLRADLVPKVTCASDAAAQRTSISEIFSANLRASTTECARYAACRRTL